jgi:hypothetical protein
VSTSGSFAGSHTHFIGSSSGSVAASDISALTKLITEHDITEDLMIVIHNNDYDTIAALTGFTALSSSLLNYSGETSTVVKLDNSNLNNRMVGLWKNSIPVWVKPFAVEHYALCLGLGSADGKPLAYRQLKWPTTQGLKLSSTSPTEPIICEQAIAFEGFAVLNRSAGAVLQLNNSTFSNPTIA